MAKISRRLIWSLLILVIRRAPPAGQPAKAPRLSSADWQTMMKHIVILSDIAWKEYGVRPVIHPHAGGCIEYEDELAQLVQDIPHSVAGLCLDTGHLYYSGMNPIAALDKYWDRIDYLHFKDINAQIWQEVIAEEVDFSLPAPVASCARLEAGRLIIRKYINSCVSAIIGAGSRLSRKGIRAMRTPACAT